MTPLPPGFKPVSRRVTLIEDVVNLSCIAALFVLFLLLPRWPAARLLLWPLLVVVTVLFLRRQMRVSRLFAAMKRAAEQESRTAPAPPAKPGGRPAPVKRPARKK
jgi:hypothetical protein